MRSSVAADKPLQTGARERALAPSFGDRLKAVRKLLFRRDPFILIAKKPSEMLAERPASYRFEALAPIIERQAKESALAKKLQAQDAVAARAKVVAAAHRNDYFPPADSETLYGVLRHLRPQRIIEVGSGYSTRIMREAIQDGGFACTLTAIDPAPRADIHSAADKIIEKSVVGLDRGVFKELTAADILFIDGSHYVFNGTDATFLFLEILPLLPPGVVVHVHDICLPYEYDPLFSSRFYNEQYLLAALLIGGQALRVEIPVYALHKEGRLGFGTSFWMTRT
jgi:predicted O-methyltransferase YrrM